MHLKSENHPRKIWNDESLQRSHSWQGWWRGREGGLLLLLPPTPSLVQSSGPPLGLQASSLSPLFSFLRFWLPLACSVARPLALSTLFFFFFPHPLFIPPHPALGLSQGLNLWLWSYRSIGMATHALLCFVSMLACRLVSLTWLCVHALHSCHDVCAPRPSKYGPLSFLFSGLVMCFSPYDRSKRRHVSCMGCFTLSSKMHLKIRVACVCECSEPENTGDLML